MALFPRFGSDTPAIPAIPAIVVPEPAERPCKNRNYRGNRSPGGEIQHAPIAPGSEVEPGRMRDAADDLAQRVADLADAWHERISICTADDIPGEEAEATAALEIGRRFVRTFMSELALPASKRMAS